MSDSISVSNIEHTQGTAIGNQASASQASATVNQYFTSVEPPKFPTPEARFDFMTRAIMGLQQQFTAIVSRLDDDQDRRDARQRQTDAIFQELQTTLIDMRMFEAQNANTLKQIPWLWFAVAVGIAFDIINFVLIVARW